MPIPVTRSSSEFTAREDLSLEAVAALAQLKSTNPPSDLADPELSPNALTVLKRRYLMKEPATGKVQETPRQLYWRVARHIAGAELIQELGSPMVALEVAREFYGMMARAEFLPNSPTLMNSGRESGMLSACFVLPVEDSVEGIYDSVKATALIQKAGGGTGFAFSRLRPRGDAVVSSGGTTAGPLSFIEVFSKASDSIQQGAFRKGANMGILRVDHPDIMEFVHFKDDRQKITNFNISVAITDQYLADLQREPSTPHRVRNPRSGEVKHLLREDGSAWTVGEIWDAIADHAHQSGEPGVVFIDRINASNPIKNVGEIEATNPCGEQPLHPYDSCNLGSVNLGKFVLGEGAEVSFDWESYRETVHTATRFLDNVIEVNKYPLTQIDTMSKTTRRIGLGVMGFADTLYRLGIAYNSPEGLAFGERVMEVMNEESHLASEALGEERGVFPAWEGSDWEQQGRRLRNSYTTTVAPTGTISILAGCSGGIEPMFSLVFERQVMVDEEGKPTIMREVNPIFESLAKEQGFYSEELIDTLFETGTLHGIAGIPENVRELFVTAHDISPEWHMRMQAAFQAHCDSSISKTINFPTDAEPEDVRRIFDLAVDLGVKGVTVYRDGCRDMQPMALKESRRMDARAQEIDSRLEETALFTRVMENGQIDLKPIKLPEIMSCLRIRQMTPFGNMHVKVAVDPITSREREVFAQLGKGGDVANSDLEAICRILSMWLRSNGSLRLALKQLAGIGSSLTVPTKDGRIMSLADGLATALERYLTAKKEHGLEALLLGRVSPDAVPPSQPAAAPAKSLKAGRSTNYKVICPSCSGPLAMEEGCALCHTCGFSMC